MSQTMEKLGPYKSPPPYLAGTFPVQTAPRTGAFDPLLLVFFFSCIFPYLLFCEGRVLDVQNDRVGMTMPQPTVRLEPREQIAVFCKPLLFRQCLEELRILASLGLDVVDVCLVCHSLGPMHRLGRLNSSSFSELNQRHSTK